VKCLFVRFKSLSLQTETWSDWLRPLLPYPCKHCYYAHFDREFGKTNKRKSISEGKVQTMMKQSRSRARRW
jgi:hypothetical protein